MDKVDNTFEQGDKYAQRLLNRSSQYSDCYSQTCRRRISVIEALNRSSINPAPSGRYEGNPFEKEFSQVNDTTPARMDDDQLEMTYVSTWPEDNAVVSCRTTYDVKPRDSLFRVKSHGAVATDRPRATPYRSSEPFRRDVVHTDVESIAPFDNLSLLLHSNEPALSTEERFGPLTTSELSMQNTLNREYDSEFEQCNAELQLQGPDEYFGGARVIEICEPTILMCHPKFCDVEAAETQANESKHTYVKDDNDKTKKEKDLYAERSLSGAVATQTRQVELAHVKGNSDKGWKETELDSKRTSSSSLGSENMRELDREIDKLQLERHDNSYDNASVLLIKASAKSKAVGASNSKNLLLEKYGFRETDCVNSTEQAVNRSSMENFKDYQKPASPKKATLTTAFDNSTQQSEHNLSKTASFIKRHTSFLFKNLLTPKLVRRKSSVEKTNKVTCSQRPQPSTNGLFRSSTMASSDKEKPATRFQQQVQQVQADLPPDMDDTMASEMESFLKVALGNVQYNSTMAHANMDLTQYSLLSNNDTYSGNKNDRTMREPKREIPKRSNTLNRTLSVYKNLTQKIRYKFRRHDRNDTTQDVLSNLYQQNSLPDDLSPELREAIKKLQEEIAVQDTRIYQTSKALQLCESMREFTVSPERVDYERLLLLASLTKNAILREIDRLINQRIYNNIEAHAYTQRGDVTLKDIRLRLREDVLRRERQNGDIVEWFVVVVIEGTSVWATHAIACPISSPQVYFPGQHVISGLTPDFRLSIRVYSMKLQQLELFNHDEKYHITRSFSSGSVIKTPKMLRRRKSISPKQYKVKFTGIKETSFIFCGSLDVMLYDLKLLSPWPLSSLIPNSVLHGTIDLSLSCRLELSILHAGFLTHCEETGDLAWSRRWCLLEGHTLYFWNYPREQEYNPPLYTIDLVNCVSSSVNLIDRKLCPRPRTLLLETKGRTNEKDHILVDGRSIALSHRHLLSCDSNKELAEWHSNLNDVVSALSDWNIIHTARTS